jgi:plastocyanin
MTISPAVAARASAQSLLDRPPNLGGTWVGNHGTIYFNFLHRFTAGDAPLRKVGNAPTFLLAAGFPARILAGFRYATNSQLVAATPNEWEFFGRFQPISEANQQPLDAAILAAYNHAAESFDGELSLGKRAGPLTLLASGRVMSQAFGRDSTRFAVGGGATIRISRHVALAGDVTTLLDRSDDEDVAWGAGLHFEIPYTPHSVSLQVTNTNSSTLQGSAAGTGQRRYGFEFTIPFTLSRYFGRRTAAAADTTGPPTGGEGQTVRMSIRNSAYERPTLVISRGTTLVWENQDQLDHTVTSDDGRFDSGMIQPNRNFSRRFDEAGTFTYHCTPHPFMKGTVVVR